MKLRFILVLFVLVVINCILFVSSHDSTRYTKVITTYTSDQIFNSMMTNIKYAGHFVPDDLTAKESTRTSRIHESSIFFPSSSSSNYRSKIGDRCITFYATTGTCQPTQKCWQDTPSFQIQTQLIVNCGVHDAEPMVCCPANSVIKTKPISKPSQEGSKPPKIESTYPHLTDPKPIPPPPPRRPTVQSEVKPPVKGPTQSEYVETKPNPKPMNPFLNIGETNTPMTSNHPNTDSMESKPISPNPVYPSKDTNTPTKVIPPKNTQTNTPANNPPIKKIPAEINPSKVPISISDASNEALESSDVCGIYNNSDRSTGNKEIWPWIVSIGRRGHNGTLRWDCLGSLITKDFIVTSAICLQQDPDIVAIGTALLGPMRASETERLKILTRRISQVMIHEKFIKPYLYKNVGLIQLSSPVPISKNILPVCFPFLASVLDILHFSGSMAKSLGFEFPVDRNDGLRFHQEEYRILSNDQCSRVFTSKKAETIERFPRGIQSDNLCGLKKTTTSICQAPGSPFVLFDEASSSHVIVGIASGDPTCAKFSRQLVTFTRMNSFSTWVRERIAVFPAPPPCYF